MADDHQYGNISECPRARQWAREAFARDLIHQLIEAAEQARSEAGEALCPLGILPRQMAIMRLLSIRAPLRQQELGTLLGIDRTSMVSLIDGLETLGYVVREADPADRRAHALRLTAAGREANTGIQAAVDRAQDRLAANLTVDERDTLIVLLGKLNSASTHNSQEHTAMSTVEAPAQGIVTYQLDPAHSTARFSVRHMMISRVHGEFGGLSGSLKFDPANHEASYVEVDIPVDTVNTHEPNRDGHLKSGDFFDVATYPKITFVSTNVEKLGEGEAKITGDLTLHGVTKSVTLNVEGSTEEVKDPWGNYRLGFTATTRVKRSEYGLTYNAALETGGVLVGDDVDITLDVQFVRPGA